MRESIDDPQRRKDRRLTLVLFVISYVFLLGLCFAAMWSFRSIRKKQFVADIEASQKLELALNREIILHEISDVVTDVRFLSTQTELYEYWQEQNAKTLDRIEREYEKFAQAKRRYDQVRLLDITGHERIRINYVNGKAVVVPRDQLQDKSKRPYFMESRHLEPEQVYISPLDLNVENGVVEVPHKPMVRFAAVSFDEQQKPRGIVVLNFKAEEILELLRKADEVIVGDMQLVNGSGYWLRHPNDEWQWGWQLPGREEYNLKTQQPDIWSQISSADSGQIVDADGTVYEFETITMQAVGSANLNNMITSQPFRTNDVLKGDEWKLISTLPRSVVAKTGANLTRVLKYYLLAAAVVLILPSWGLAQLGMSWWRRRRELYRRGHFDKVTNLPNRTLFMDRLGQVHRQAARYNRIFGLLFIDLDGFKEVNDRFGHDAGDELLCEAGKRIGECIRQSDTAARMGGDEFVVVLSELTSHDDAANVAQKIIQVLAVPVELDNGRAVIGCSIGIAVYPEDGADTTELLFKSDAAMYRAKKQGKGRFCLSEDTPEHQPDTVQWRS